MADETADQSTRHGGRVARIRGDYGFIHSPISPGKDLYFRISWFRGTPPLAEGEPITFEMRVFEGREQAHHIQRIPAADGSVLASATGRSVAPTSDYLLAWAYLGHVPTALDKLAALALRE